MRVQAKFETLMTVRQMAAADTAAPDWGVPSMHLMEAAGKAVADEIGRRFSAGSAIVYCGPGNNGGDGYVAARVLKQRGWQVRCESLIDPFALTGDAAQAYARWDGPTVRLEAPPAMGSVSEDAVHIDALFGAGLSRPLEGPAAAIADWSRHLRARFVAVDVPSGISGDTGLALDGRAVHADLTVTFVRRKPGHLLLPGRTHCGAVVLADIGMPTEALRRAFEGEDSPAVQAIAGGVAHASRAGAHKYDRGHCLVVSGGYLATGAARLAALAAARAGAGLTTIAADAAAAAIHAAHLTSVMVRSDPLADLLADPRRNAVVIGPGLGLDDDARHKVNIVLGARRATVLDADALTLIASDIAQGIQKTHESCVLTPHGGEFARLFPDLNQNLSTIGKLDAARQAARRANATIVLKGADTVIAAPDGRAAIDSLAPPFLATAGSGDVLSGLIAGLLAQGLDPFAAACGGVFLHGAAASRLGPGLTADDLPGAVPGVLAGLEIQPTRD